MLGGFATYLSKAQAFSSDRGSSFVRYVMSRVLRLFPLAFAVALHMIYFDTTDFYTNNLVGINDACSVNYMRTLTLTNNFFGDGFHDDVCKLPMFTANN